ncbi:hypothetical protein [Fulvivirga lutea]|uniref:Uncharacterized protein n=1 Tax=Fulvivirga lutea TaxID=2810512 RepID=A0A974WIM2_9BACT|nr:hypothetical protein [Fulvivirga lutea]QSE96033.1 hypothetical protein JR347_10435 [Fulvivirga lutea]
MKKLLFLIICIPTLSFSQSVSAVTDTKSANPGEVIDQLPLPPPKLEGTFYLNEDWVEGDLWLKNQKVLRGFPLKYDLKNQLLEIKTEYGIKVCQLPLIEKFVIKQPLKDSIHYYNTSVVNNITFDVPKGICEILVNDKVKVIKYQYMEIKEATYNVALSAGERNDKVLKKDKHYVIVRDQVFELKNKVKKNDEVFGQKTSEVEAFAKKNNLKLKDDAEIIKVFEYYNSLI